MVAVMEVKAHNMEMLRRKAGRHDLDCTRSADYLYCACGADEALAILDRLSPPAPEQPDEIERWVLKSMTATAHQFGDGQYHAYQRTRQVLSELIASKDAEIERLRNVAKVNCDIANDCASELAALRAENERLKATLNTLGTRWALRKAAERNTAEPADEGIPGKDYSDAKATDALKEAVALSRKRSVTDTAPVVEVTVDSGMDAEAVEQAELLWAQLPVIRKWTSIPTHEKALVCHLLSTYRTEAEARGRREALEDAHASIKETARFGNPIGTPYEQGVTDQVARSLGKIDELKRLMTERKRNEN